MRVSSGRGRAFWIFMDALFEKPRGPEPAHLGETFRAILQEYERRHGVPQRARPRARPANNGGGEEAQTLQKPKQNQGERPRAA